MPSPQQPDPQQETVPVQSAVEGSGSAPRNAAAGHHSSCVPGAHALCRRCKGNHRVAAAVAGGLHKLGHIVEARGGKMPIDTELLSRDLRATVLAGELRSFTVQVHTTTVLAMWALVVRDKGYAFLAPESEPSTDALRDAQWRVVMFRRHLIPALDEGVLDCAGLVGEGDPFHRWESAAVLEGPERKSGSVWRLPREDKVGVVHGEDHTAEQPVELGLLVPDFRSYAHCRCHIDHETEAEAEADCARLVRHERITYIPMRWELPRGGRVPVAFLVGRATPQDRPHPSSVGLSPVP